MLFLETSRKIQKSSEDGGLARSRSPHRPRNKNPLTPIQFRRSRLRSATRISWQRTAGSWTSVTTTNIQQVDELKNLVTIFPVRALPSARPMPNDLNEIVNEASCFSKRTSRHRVSFRRWRSAACGARPRPDETVLMNLLDNAVRGPRGRGGDQARDQLRARRAWYAGSGDNGCGLAPELRTKISSPIFLLKKTARCLGTDDCQPDCGRSSRYIPLGPNDPRELASPSIAGARDTGAQIWRQSAVH